MDHATAIDAPIVGARRRYDAVSLALHWLTSALLVVLFIAIWMRGQASDGEAAAMLLTLHRSAGVLLWMVTLARLIWKATAARAPALPATMSHAQRWAARGNEYALYLLLIAQPITGFTQSIAHGKPMALLGFTFPAIMTRDKGMTHLFHQAHETGAFLLLALVGLHAGAALFHGVVRRDGVLGSMLPGGFDLFRK